MDHYQDNPYGAARFATFEEVCHAGLLRPHGVEFGLVRGRPLFHNNRAGVKVTGGAGSGKTSQTAIPMILGSRGVFVLLDVKNGEITRVIEPHCALSGIPLYTLDPYGVTGFPQLRTSLLSHLKSGSSTLVPDSQRFWQAILPDSGGDSRFFDQAGRRFGDAVTRHDVGLNGSTSLLRLFEIFSMLRADFSAWRAWADIAKDHGTLDLIATFAEMAEMYEASPKTFDSIVAGVSNALAFMTDPAIQATFVDDTAADFSLEVIADPGTGPVFVSLILPEEVLEPLAPLVRQFFSSVRTIKQRRPDAPPVNLLIDEAARLGRFGELADFFAIGRGAGLTPWVFYQDDGQIVRNLGPTGKATIEANAALMLDLGGGIRDYETARARSNALGYQTITVDDPLTQMRGQSAALELKRKVLLEGADPFEAAYRLRQLDYEAMHRTKMRKALMEPEELLRLDSGKMLVQARGYHLRPFIAQKLPYFRQRRFAGRYFPNPNEERDTGSVAIKTFWGTRRRKIIKEPVPSSLSHLPQYAGGRPLRYVAGFKPKT
ncbi:type IV secretory system conjugative DNA transfer family protein [Leisingera sp. F5]|uniref:type IV secretory system conjugative DNA transfer family protein n=1 Tax=Leisingera sp. F5 TaxID=1813816 RepID=UPI000A95B2C2|nr:type IV secretory system conjugative DNA transfer family protein [Leisingera sp. F5]